jgi:hypothetical protein
MATVDGVGIPDTKLCREITEFVRDVETDLLFNHSSRVYYFGALAGQRRGLNFDRELVYAGAMFHDLGLMPGHSSPTERFELDGANAARAFLRARGIAPMDVTLVWASVALHTTPDIPAHMHPVIALVSAGVLMDAVGLGYEEFPDAQREAVVAAYPRSPRFKEDFIQASYDGMKHKPDTTLFTLNADYLADKDPHFRRGNVCTLIRESRWSG